MKRYIQLFLIALILFFGLHYNVQAADLKVSALTANTDPQLTDGLYWVDDIGGTPASNKILWGTLLDDTKGNGDTAYAWSADKIYDQLALKVPLSAFTQDSGILVGTGAGTYAEETGATLRTSIGIGTGDSPQFTGLTLTQFDSNIDLNEKYLTEDETSLTDSDAPTPNLSGTGTYYEFTDDGTTDVDTITGFSNFPSDTNVEFRFEDAYWIIDFSGTNLYGHGGLDWTTRAGDSMICRSHDGTKIECIVSHPSSLAISKYYNIPLDSTPDSDDSWHGMTIELENASGGALAQWDLVYLRPDGAGQEGGMYPWDADLATYKAYKPIGVVIESGGIADNATGTVGIGTGIGRNDGWTAFADNTDEGKTVYGTTTAGAISDTAPSTTGDVVCAVGIVLDDDEIQFNFGLCASVEVP